MSPCGGGGECGVSVNDNSCTHRAQINFGDLTPYITYDPQGAYIPPPLPPPQGETSDIAKLSDSYPVFFLPSATTFDKNF